MRHLRRMKRLYSQRLALMLSALLPLFPQVQLAGLAYGMAPSLLSVWYQPGARCQNGWC